MKNMIIAMLVTYIFYTDLCVVHIPAMLPLMFVTFWLIIAESEEQLKEYRRQRHRRRYLQEKINRIRRIL